MQDWVRKLLSHRRLVGAVRRQYLSSHRPISNAGLSARGNDDQAKGWHVNESSNGLFSDLSASEPVVDAKSAEQLAAERETAAAERSNTDTAEQRQSQLFSG